MTNSEVVEILQRWDVEAMARALAVAAQAKALFRWIDRKWVGARAIGEVPVEATSSNGQRVRGQIDLLVDTADGRILIDHKVNPGGTVVAPSLAATYGAQIEMYANAVTAVTGRGVIERWPYQSIAGAALCISATVQLR